MALALLAQAGNNRSTNEATGGAYSASPGPTAELNGHRSKEGIGRSSSAQSYSMIGSCYQLNSLQLVEPLGSGVPGGGGGRGTLQAGVMRAALTSAASRAIVPDDR